MPDPRFPDLLRTVTAVVAGAGDDLAERTTDALARLRILGAVDGSSVRLAEWEPGTLAAVDDGGAVHTGVARAEVVEALAGGGLRLSFDDEPVAFGHDQTAPHDDAGSPSSTASADDIEAQAALDEAVTSFVEGPAVETWIVSRRGPGWARWLAWRTGAPVEVAVVDGWSVLRYRAAAGGGPAPASPGELPSIRVHNAAGATYIEVDVAGDRMPYLLFPDDGAHARPTIPLDSLEPRTRRLARRLVDANEEGDSTVCALQADAAAAVDGAALREACAPISVGGATDIRDRLVRAVEAFAVPSALITQALGDEPLPEVVWPSSLPRLLLADLDDGAASLRPLGGRTQVWQRLVDSIRARPWLVATIAAAELAGGAALIRGSRNALARSTGALLLFDAAIDGTLLARRLRRRRSSTP